MQIKMNDTGSYNITCSREEFMVIRAGVGYLAPLTTAPTYVKVIRKVLKYQGVFKT